MELALHFAWLIFEIMVGIKTGNRNVVLIRYFVNAKPRVSSSTDSLSLFSNTVLHI